MSKKQENNIVNDKFDLTIIYPGYTFYNYHFFDEINKLADKGYQIKCIFVRGIRSDSHFESDHSLSKNLEVEVWNFKGIRVKDYTLSQNLKLLKLILKTVLKSRTILTSTQAPLHSKYVFFLSRIMFKKIAVIVEQWEDYTPNNFFMKIYKKLGYYIIKNADRVFVHGLSQYEFVTEYLKANKEKVLIFPFLSRIPTDKKTISKDSNIVKILYFGRITEQKGLDILIQAFNKIKTNKEINLLVCGGVDKRFYWEAKESQIYFDYCKKLASENKNINFYGEIDPTEKEKYFMEADIFVHPHKNFQNKNEGWGLVINEAISYGLPVITTTKVGSATTLITNEKNGYIIEPGDINHLKEKLENLIENDELRRNFSLGSLQIFNNYHKPEKIKYLLEKFIRD